jgi:large subunit ribosomal protein L24
MLKFKIGDTVKIVLGKDSGREGKIEAINVKKKLALVPGVNLYKKHIKKTMAKDQKGGRYDIPRPLPFSKIALICPKCKKITRVGFRLVEKEKVRICKKCRKEINSK